MLISIVWHFVQSDVNRRIGLCCSVFYQPIVLKMASFGSPLKLEPSSPKRQRPEIMWDKCIFFQRPSLENLICMRSISKNSFIEELLSMEPGWTTDQVWMTAESGIDPVSSCILFKLCEWSTVVFASICFLAWSEVKHLHLGTVSHRRTIILQLSFQIYCLAVHS
jgi:hypothetical protein